MQSPSNLGGLRWICPSAYGPSRAGRVSSNQTCKQIWWTATWSHSMEDTGPLVLGRSFCAELPFRGWTYRTSTSRGTSRNRFAPRLQTATNHKQTAEYKKTRYINFPTTEDFCSDFCTMWSLALLSWFQGILIRFHMKDRQISVFPLKDPSRKVPLNQSISYRDMPFNMHGIVIAFMGCLE